MRYVKALGLSAMTVATITAFLGVSSAAAAPTVLCKVAELPCAAANRYPSDAAFIGESEGKTKLEGISSSSETELTVECDSKARAQGTSSSEESLQGELTALSFTDCSNSCTFAVNGLPYAGSLTWTSGSNGTLIVRNPSGTLSCDFGLVQCRASVKEVAMTFDGGNPAKVLAAKVPIEIEPLGASKCPATAVWTATYKIPGAVFVSHA